VAPDPAASGAPAPVAIVGLGPVGAVLALGLAQAGVPVVVVERDRAPHTLPRAAHLDDDALRVLAGLGAGIAEAVVADGRAIDGFRLVDARGRTLLHARKRLRVETGWPAATLVHQPTVERALRAALAAAPGVEIRPGHTVEGVEAGPDGAVVHGQAPGGPFAIPARFVVGCDGARSRVREAMGARLVGGRFEEPWLVVDTLLRRDVPLPTDLLQIADARRPATFVPFPGRRRRWEFRLRSGETAEAMTRPEAVRALLAQHVDPDAVEVERAVVYTFHDLVARPWRRGPLLLAGDAAHQMPPFLGQGLGAGLHDAATLAWTLALVWHGTADEALLDVFEAERRPHVEAVTRLAVRLGRLVSAGGMAVRLRDAALHASARVGPLRRRLLAIRAPLPDVRPVLGVPPAVARVPNTRLVGPDGAEARFDGLLGPRFAVVGVGVDARAWAGASDVWTRLGAQFVTVGGPGAGAQTDPDGHLGRWIGRTPAVVVVRPDRLAFGVYAPSDGARAAADLRRDLRLTR
jgi:3-(3-hydroxy-phenyl)propionate hydroxylase